MSRGYYYDDDDVIHISLWRVSYKHVPVHCIERAPIIYNVALLYRMIAWCIDYRKYLSVHTYTFIHGTQINFIFMLTNISNVPTYNKLLSSIIILCWSSWWRHRIITTYTAGVVPPYLNKISFKSVIFISIWTSVRTQF